MSTNYARRAFSMVEVVFATMIVGGLVVSSLSLIGSAAIQKQAAANKASGMLLCQAMVEEISTRSVSDWAQGKLVIGDAVPLKAEAVASVKDGEITKELASRSTYTTIDEYDNHIQSPPLDESGTQVGGYTGWTRTVDVSVVPLSDANGTSATETGLRRITVTASFAGKPAATLVFLRSSEWEEVSP